MKLNKTIFSKKFILLSLIVISAMALIGCEAKNKEDEVIEEITEFTYGENEYGYFTSNGIKYDYLGSENNSIIFKSEDDKSTVQLTDLSEVLKDDTGEFDQFLTIQDKQTVFENIVNEYSTNQSYNVSQKDKNTYIIKVIGDDVLTEYISIYSEISKNIKDPTVYIILTNELTMGTFFADGSYAYNLSKTFSNSGESSISIDLNDNVDNISFISIDIQDINTTNSLQLENNSTNTSN